MLIETVRFLRRNPSETVVISYREEYDPSANTETFEETFDRYLKPNDLVKGKKTPGLYNVKWTTEKLWTANKVPALSEVRGKVVMLNMKRDGRCDGTQGICSENFDAIDDDTAGGCHPEDGLLNESSCSCLCLPLS